MCICLRVIRMSAVSSLRQTLCSCLSATHCSHPNSRPYAFAEKDKELTFLKRESVENVVWCISTKKQVLSSETPNWAQSLFHINTANCFQLLTDSFRCLSLQQHSYIVDITLWISYTKHASVFYFYLNHILPCKFKDKGVVKQQSCLLESSPFCVISQMPSMFVW